MSRIFYLVVVCLLLPTPALAAGDFTAYGIETASCGKYIQDTSRSAVVSANYEWWLAGFITGSNLRKGRSTQIDLQGLTSWVNSYCQRNPLDAFMNAVSELDKELDKRSSRAIRPNNSFKPNALRYTNNMAG